LPFHYAIAADSLFDYFAADYFHYLFRCFLTFIFIIDFRHY
jgi:hypothetical protein